MGDYKIYYNDSHLVLTSDSAQMNKNFAKVFTTEKETKEFLANPLALFDDSMNGNILAVCDKPEEILKRLMKNLQLVLAGGGILWNENNELLMIYRRGKWDLAKGKIELNESIKDGAVREVEEETGVQIESVNPEPVHTYHAYKLKGKNSLKDTSWYEMKALPGQNKLVPQTKEDIAEVRWVKRTELKNYEQGCYPLIWDLIKGFQL
ncbi:MAG: NUDIX domain-containing protein [Bacteroidetes bacterium]|nr:NUDIX domain-containing protein [Bacteroidota bacterium]